MDWLVWNQETRSITKFGKELDMRHDAAALNQLYQTDAYLVKHYTP